MSRFDFTQRSHPNRTNAIDEPQVSKAKSKTFEKQGFQRIERDLAGEPGLEPRLTESESVVLPLNYSPADAAGARLGCCAALITKSARIANTVFEKIRG
jgi:hypothetical protein